MKKEYLVIIGLILITFFVISLLFFRNTYLPEILAFLIMIVIVASLLAKIPIKTQEEKKTSFPLPIKTKIAAWWMTLIGGIGLIAALYLYIGIQSNSGGCLLGPGLLLSYITPPSVGLFLPGFLILIKKRLGWWLAVIVLFIGTIITGYISLVWINQIGAGMRVESDFTYLLISLIPIIPLILLLLDRKNFFKIAS